MLSHCPSEGAAALGAAASVWCFRKCLSALSNKSCADGGPCSSHLNLLLF